MSFVALSGSQQRFVYLHETMHAQAFHCKAPPLAPWMNLPGYYCLLIQAPTWAVCIERPPMQQALTGYCMPMTS